jgi:hypothetical protein
MCISKLVLAAVLFQAIGYAANCSMIWNGVGMTWNGQGMTWSTGSPCVYATMVSDVTQVVPVGNSASLHIARGYDAATLALVSSSVSAHTKPVAESDVLSDHMMGSSSHAISTSDVSSSSEQPSTLSRHNSTSSDYYGLLDHNTRSSSRSSFAVDIRSIRDLAGRVLSTMAIDTLSMYDSSLGLYKKWAPSVDTDHVVIYTIGIYPNITTIVIVK